MTMSTTTTSSQTEVAQRLEQGDIVTIRGDQPGIIRSVRIDGLDESLSQQRVVVETKRDGERQHIDIARDSVDVIQDHEQRRIVREVLVDAEDD